MAKKKTMNMKLLSSNAKTNLHLCVVLSVPFANLISENFKEKIRFAKPDTTITKHMPYHFLLK